jgi:hypothetical protein
MTIMRLDLAVTIAVNVVLSIAVAVLWTRYFRSKPSKRVRFSREEFEIDPANVPQFKATWRNAR